MDGITDIVGKSGRAMIEALIAGETSPVKLAGLADRRIKASPAVLAESLRGRVTKHHRFLLQLHLAQIDALDRAMAEIDRPNPSGEVEANLEPFCPLIPILISAPGISELAARTILAEIGTVATSFARADMSRFQTSGHLIPSFRRHASRMTSGLCPKNDESAGKRRSTRMRKGAPWLKTTLFQCASWRSHAPHGRQGRARRAAICRRCSIASVPEAAPRSPSARSPHRSSRPSIT